MDAGRHDLTMRIHADPALIQQDFIEVLPRITSANARYAQALEEFRVAELNLERVEARLSMLTRETILTEGRKPTEAMIRECVVQDGAYQKARLDLIATEADKVRAKGVVDQLFATKEMLITLGAHLRVELAADPMIRRRATSTRDMLAASTGDADFE